jgi:hypothetical protein
MLIGVLCWSAFAAVALALQREILMDEAAVPAQIIAGVVKYPGGHPHDVFYKTAYSFPNVAGAWFLAVWNSDLAFSAVRNWLFFSLSLVTPFAATLALTRRASWAHLAVAITLFGAHTQYDGVYPMFVFPHFYSHGHIGLQLTVLTGALIVGRQWMTGGVLAGIIPAMHAAMTLTVWPWVAGYVLWLWKAGDRATARRILIGSGIGVAFSVVAALLIPLASSPIPPVMPYDALPGAEGARAGFEAISDTHRMLPISFLSRAYLLSPAALLALGYLLAWSKSSLERRWTEEAVDAIALVGLGLFSIAIVYGVGLMHVVLGTLPDAVSMPMPYRFSNVTATLLVPVTVAAIAGVVGRMDDRDEWLGRVVVAIAVALLGVAMSGFVPLSVREAVTRQMLFLLWGLPFGLALWAFGSIRSQRWHLLMPAGGFLLAALPLWASSKGALYFVVAAVSVLAGIWIVRRLVPKVELSSLRRLSAGAVGFAVVVCVVGVLTARNVDAHSSRVPAARADQLIWKISDDDLAIRKWLAENASPTELVLTPIYPQFELQAKARQPVLFEPETLWLMTYKPSLAPLIGTMTRDLYGIDYERASDYVEKCPNGRVAYWCDVFADAWKTRTRSRWIELGRKYRFRLVVAPPTIPLDLPVTLHTSKANVYEIPQAVEPDRD